MQKNVLEQIYRAHHARGSRYGYLFCHGGRVPYFRKWIGEGKRVLDLGCRDGMLTQGYAKGNEIVGVDIDQKALELIKRRLNIETHWLDLNEEWPFENGSFDVIIAAEILEHLFYLDSLLHKIHTVLKPNGLFLGSVPNAFRIRNRFKFLFGEEFEKDPTHVRLFSYDKLKKDLHSLYPKVEIIPIQGKIFPFVPVSPTFPNTLNRLFARDLIWRAEKGV